ncbi:MAG: DegV family protein [Oscillospiraceae bacterium]
MNSDYILSCESTVDVPFTFMKERNIPVLFYKYTVDSEVYVDDMCRDPEALPRFYSMLNEGKLPSTSQINTYEYCEFFEDLLKENDNILHVAFGSGMTNSVNNAYTAVEMLKEKYPHKKIVVIDSLCSSSGYGLLMEAAAEMRDKGCSMDVLEQWLLVKRHCVHHQFFSTDLKFFRRSGRVSGPTATIGTILNICPIMRLNDKGKIVAYDKVRGKKNAILKTISEMENTIPEGKLYSGKCYLSHSNCPDMAIEAKKAIEEHFPHIDGGIKVFDIGTIIASHAGPGTVAVFYFGDKVKPLDN